MAESQLQTLGDWITADPLRTESRLRLTAAVLGAALLMLIAGFTTYLWRIGARILRSSRFPAPGMAVIRDTIVLHGPSARRRGHLLQWLGVLLSLATAGFVITLWLLVSLLSGRAA